MRHLDLLIILGLLLAIGLYAMRFVDLSVHPFEDAAILMRYSQHLAEGHGIVWNVGEKPVDGATDFLFMVLVAVLVKAGMCLEIATRLIGFSCHILGVATVYLAVTRLHGLSRWAALISAAYLGIGPGLKYIETYFGTTFFALAACVTWCLAVKLTKESTSHIMSCMFAISALVMGLTRPEGVFLGLFMLLAILTMNGLEGSWKVLVYFLGIFAILGGVYFFWRWNYFGHPLPNPFYKKGAGHLYLDSLYMSIRNATALSLPFAWAFILGLRSPKAARQAIFSLIPIIGFTAIWVLLSSEMNYFRRFQYPILPLVLISWPPLVKGILKEWNLPGLDDLGRRSRLTLVLLISVIAVGMLMYGRRISTRGSSFRDGRYDVAVMLREYSHKRYTMATTETGLLPLYSKWRAIDTWGLNDQWIAHKGEITESYLDVQKPHIIVLHAHFSPIVRPSGGGAWFRMVMTLKSYAEKNGYCLAAAFGDVPFDTHYYYVRSDFPESAEIIRRIRTTDYIWYATGRRCIDYAMLRVSHN